MPDVTPGPIGYELQSFPVGTVLLWTTSTVPKGWLLCDGSAFSSTTYPALYSVFPYSTVPDLRSRLVIGYNSISYPMFSTGGAETVTLTPAQMGIPNHSHVYYDRRQANTNFADTGSTDTSVNGVSVPTFTTGGVTEANASSAHNNMQPYITLNFIVKAVA